MRPIPLECNRETAHSYLFCMTIKFSMIEMRYFSIEWAEICGCFCCNSDAVSDSLPLKTSNASLQEAMVRNIIVVCEALQLTFEHVGGDEEMRREVALVRNRCNRNWLVLSEQGITCSLAYLKYAAVAFFHFHYYYEYYIMIPVEVTLAGMAGRDRPTGINDTRLMINCS